MKHVSFLTRRGMVRSFRISDDFGYSIQTRVYPFGRYPAYHQVRWSRVKTRHFNDKADAMRVFDLMTRQLKKKMHRLG